jgi:tRNA-binding EMAP/Myf-like protein
LFCGNSVVVFLVLDPSFNNKNSILILLCKDAVDAHAGTYVVVVIYTNIEPRKIGNIISNGMLLAADGYNGKPIFLTINEEAPIGTNIH